MSANCITVKSTFAGDLRRFTLTPEDCLAECLTTKVAALYGLDPCLVSIKYRDNEGDVLSIHSDADLLEAVEGASKNLLRLEVSAENKIQAPDRVDVSIEDIKEMHDSVSMEDLLPTHAEAKAVNEEAKAAAKAEKATAKELKAAAKAEKAAAKAAAKAEKQAAKHAEKEASTFSTLLHIPSGVEFPVLGKCLPNGRCVFQLTGRKGNIKIGDGGKGKISHNGGEGPWAQWEVVYTEHHGARILNHGHREKRRFLGLEEATGELVMDDREGDMEAAVWALLTADRSDFVPSAAAWHTEKVAKKAAAKAEKEAAKAEKEAAKAAKQAAKKMKAEAAGEVCEQKNVDEGIVCMRSTISLVGCVDGSTLQGETGVFLAVHGSNQRDVLDKNALFTMVTSEPQNASIWSIVRGGFVPEDLVAINLEGNIDGRTNAQGWTLMVASVSKSPHKRDGHSAYLVATRAMGKKGGFWAIEPAEEDPSRCALRYVGNRDGRAGAEGWYLAVHSSHPLDHRDEQSEYVLVTQQKSKASLWDIRPFWGEIPMPQRKKMELDSMGNPMVGFHTAKKAALFGLHDAAIALSTPAEGVNAPTEVSAGAAMHSLRIGCEWLRRKTGLPIMVDDTTNEEALHIIHQLRTLEMPRWAAELNTDETSVDAVVAALGARMQSLWEDTAQDENNLHDDDEAAVKTLKQTEKEASKAKKEAEKAGANAEKEAAKAAAKAEKEAQKAAAKAEKEAQKAAAKAEKEVTQAAAKAAKEAQKAAAKAEKEAAKAEKEAAKALQKAAKEAQKAAKAEAKKKPAEAVDTDKSENPTPASVPLLQLASLASTLSSEEQDKLTLLQSMGFGTPRANQHALAAADGNVEAAIEFLLTSDYTIIEADGDGAVEMSPPPSYRSSQM